MTAPQATDPGVFLDRLEETRDAIGDSPAFRVVGFEQGADVDHWVYARFDDGGQALFAECYGADAARVIAASLTSLPALIAAVRAEWERHQDDGSGFCRFDGLVWPCIAHRELAETLAGDAS